MLALIDSGASGNFISVNEVERHNIPVTALVQSYQLGTIDGTTIDHNSGRVDTRTQFLSMQVMDHRENMTFDVTNTGSHQAVLGIPWLKQHNPDVDWINEEIRFTRCRCRHTVDELPREVCTAQAQSQGSDDEERDQEILVSSTTELRNPDVLKESTAVKNLWPNRTACQRSLHGASLTTSIPEELSQFRRLFEEELDSPLPEHQPWDHSIPLLPDTTPPFGPIYSLTEKETQELREYLDVNLRKGFIRPSTSSAGAPILFVPKKNGKLRLVVDYRRLNAITNKNRYPLPLINEIPDKLRAAKWYTKLDLRGAYNLIRMKEGEEWKTAFRTRFGLFEYLVMPFGLTNAPASFQALINDLLREYLDVFCTAYLDDILIYSENLEDHKRHVAKVLERLARANLAIEPEKSEFYKNTVEYLGFVISEKGVEMEDSKVAAIKSWPEPKCVKDLQAFLGFTNYYRRWIAQYSRITSTLTELTKKDRQFTWNASEQRAFDELKKRFTVGNILVMFDPNKPIIMETDASDYAIGASISQEQAGKLRPVAFHSRKMSPAEQNYEIHDKELLAVVVAFEQWRMYLEGAKHTVTVYSDHQNLRYFTSTKKLNRRQARWAEQLSIFDFNIVHQKGSVNTQADALSRRADYQQDKQWENSILFKEKADGGLTFNTPELSAITVINPDHMLDKIRANYTTSEKENPSLRERDGLLELQGRILIPEVLQQEIIKDYHDDPLQGHGGRHRTMEKIMRTYYIPRLSTKVAEYIKKCDVCQRTKHSRHKPFGCLQLEDPPPRPWHTITLDFITELPESKEPHTETRYNSILVICDKLTKFSYFVPVRTDNTSRDMVYVLQRTVVANHGLPRVVISDRDRLFTAKFWKSLWQDLEAEHRLSTAFHPQTDGQTERTNQTLEQYLRAYVNYKQDDWVRLLPIAQHALNNARNDTTGETPFYANYGYHPFQGQLTGSETTPEAEDLKKIHQQLNQDIRFVQARTAQYFNKRRVEPSLRKGDCAYLIMRNRRTNRPSKKLDYTKAGPFTVLEQKGPVTYKLQLPKTWKIHPVFHASVLEPTSVDTPERPNPEIHPDGQEPEYEVESIKDHRKDARGRSRYLVKWKGYTDNECTWEPENNLTHCAQLLQNYRRVRTTGNTTRQKKNQPRKSQRTSRQACQ